MFFTRVMVVSGLTFSALPAFAAGSSYTYTTLATTYIQTLRGINELGQVVGDDYGGASGFVYSAGAITHFGAPTGWIFASSVAINKHGLVLANDKSAAGLKGTFTYDMKSGEYRQISVPGAFQLVGTALNDAGSITGSAITNMYDQTSQGFLIVGTASMLFRPHGAELTTPTFIADDGTVVGDYHDRSGLYSRGFVYRAGDFVYIDAPGGTFETSVTSVDAHGVVTGNYSGEGTPEWFTYRNGIYQEQMKLGTALRALPDALLFGVDANLNSYPLVITRNSFCYVSPPGVYTTFVYAVNKRGDYIGESLAVVDNQQITSQFVATLPPGAAPCQ